MEGLLNVLLALVDPGDEVVVTDPTYAGIVNRIRLAGGTPTFIPFLAADEGWRFDREALDRIVGPRTTGFLLMSPSMPSGGYLDEDDWRAVCGLCRERDLFLVYDAAMERLLFDGRPLVHPLTLDGMGERTVVVGSLSKEHRMIGWRVGWVAGPESTVTDVGWAHVYNTTCPVSIARKAGAAVLRGDQDHVADCVAELERRRDTMLEGLPGWPFVKPAGGWSLLLDVASLGFEPEEASQLLLEESQIAATGMRGWGDEVAERYVRFVFSAEPVERLAEIPERLAGGKLAAAVSALA
jgi:aspartate/methionine/tyrosine aminotransferase